MRALPTNDSALTELEVSVIYEQLADPHAPDFSAALEAAVRIGHAGALVYGLEQLGLTPVPGPEPENVRLLRRLPRQTLHQALINALNDRGRSIDDHRTAPGALYQALYGEDYALVQRVTGQGDTSELSYAALSDEEQAAVRTQLLQQRGLTLDDYLPQHPADVVPPHCIAVSATPNDEPYTVIASVAGSDTLYADRLGALILRAAPGASPCVWHKDEAYLHILDSDAVPATRFFEEHGRAIQDAKQRAAAAHKALARNYLNRQSNTSRTPRTGP